MRLRLSGIARASKTRDSRFDSCQTHQYIMNKKHWYLRGPYSESDLVWLRNSNLDIQVIEPETTSHGSSHMVTAGHRIYIYTLNEQEEMWVKLRCHDRVELMSSQLGTLINIE